MEAPLLSGDATPVARAARWRIMGCGGGGMALGA